VAWLVRALREAKGSEEGECGGCRRSGSKERLNDDEQLTIWITELGMAESEPGMQRVDWVWARVPNPNPRTSNLDEQISLQSVGGASLCTCPPKTLCNPHDCIRSHTARNHGAHSRA